MNDCGKDEDVKKFLCGEVVRDFQRIRERIDKRILQPGKEGFEFSARTNDVPLDKIPLDIIKAAFEVPSESVYAIVNYWMFDAPVKRRKLNSFALF